MRPCAGQKRPAGPVFVRGSPIITDGIIYAGTSHVIPARDERCRTARPAGRRVRSRQPARQRESVRIEWGIAKRDQRLGRRYKGSIGPKPVHVRPNGGNQPDERRDLRAGQSDVVPDVGHLRRPEGRGAQRRPGAAPRERAGPQREARRAARTHARVREPLQLAGQRHQHAPPGRHHAGQSGTGRPVDQRPGGARADQRRGERDEQSRQSGCRKLRIGRLPAGVGARRLHAFRRGRSGPPPTRDPRGRDGANGCPNRPAADHPERRHHAAERVSCHRTAGPADAVRRGQERRVPWRRLAGPPGQRAARTGARRRRRQPRRPGPAAGGHSFR